MPSLLPLLSGLLLTSLIALAPLHAALPDHELPSKEAVQTLSDQASNWLLSQQQDDGAFFPGDQFRLGITALVTLALLDGGLPADNPAIQQAVGFIKRHIQADGGIYHPQEGLGNYGTALSLRVLLRTGADQTVIEKAQNYLIGLQNTDEDSVAYGGIGYGSRGEGNEDLSNTSMAVEALTKSGLPADDPALQRALAFIERCQNLSSHNPLPWAGSDGGAVYSPDSSKAGGSYHDGTQSSKPPAGQSGGAVRMESYGSMTYALISSYIYLELKPDDPRLAAALDWCRANYQFEINPGMPPRQLREGLFYYYQAMAKTYDLTEITELDLGSKDGVHDWRADLFANIQERAQFIDLPDGRAGALWMNDMQRWGEGIPHLSTAYMLSSLSRIARNLD